MGCPDAMSLPSFIKSREGNGRVDLLELGCGRVVPMLTIDSMHELTRLIGHAKYNYRDYGEVLYRGECSLHDSLIPSLFRSGKSVNKATKDLNDLLKEIRTDAVLRTSMKLVDGSSGIEDLWLEGVLQHYGVPTRYIDVVDNHWVALWMCLNRAEKKIGQKSGGIASAYCRYVERSACCLRGRDQSLCCKCPSERDIYGYVHLLAIPFSEGSASTDGVSFLGKVVRVDLRKALPSLFVRPHAQHGFVVKKVGANGNQKSYYDMGQYVVVVLRVRVDRVRSWLGGGGLLTQDNLFPSPCFDPGYDLLLSRNDLFEGHIVKYV